MNELPISVKPLFDAQTIHNRVKELGHAINEFYGQEPLVAVCVLKGAFMFFSDLVRQISNGNIELDFVRLASYGMNSESSKHVIFTKDIQIDILNKHVLIVEDIVDSGHTMRFLLDQFAARTPRSLRIAALLDKHERREAKIDVDFVGFKISNGFMAGYGLDYAEKFRAVPYIFEVDLEYVN